VSELSEQSPAPKLVVDDLRVSYGAIRAVQGVSLQIGTGSVVALIGSNGAGKSSILKAIAGLVNYRGTVNVSGGSLEGCSAEDRVVEHGVVLVPEGRGVFATMTVLENLNLGLRVGGLRARRGARAAFVLDDVLDLFPPLRAMLKTRAQLLSGGEQQMLSLGRSLLMRPELMLIDEPSMGLAPVLVKQVFTALRGAFARSQVSVLLVEQDTSVALELAARAYVLEHGAVVAEDTTSVLRGDPRLHAAYLGGAVPP
jgi:branched-chain amino acid transport system ATP-binding protein